MAQLPSTRLQPAVVDPWIPHIPPRTRSWHSSRGRVQVAGVPLQQLKDDPGRYSVRTAAVAAPAEAAEQAAQARPPPDTQSYEFASWKRQQVLQEIARARISKASNELLGDEAEAPETEEDRHQYNAAQDWEGRHAHSRSYQSIARASAEWSPWQCLAGSFREEQPVQASRQLLFTRQTDDQAHALEHLSVTADGAMEGSRLRGDGNFEQSWYTSMQANQEADGFCQEVPHTTGPLRKRALAATPNELASVHRALPLNQFLRRPKGSRAPRTSDYTLGATFHNQDGRSWNVAVRYSLDTCQLLGFHTERDFALGEADPSQSISFSELPRRGVQPAGPRLDGRAASWLPGRWHGQATSITFDEDGRIWRRKAHGCSWAPPNNHRREFLYGLWTLPDSCYVFAPLQMPQTERGIPMEGVRIECGVMPSPTTLRRSVMLFDARGQLGKIRFETYQRQRSEANHRLGA